MIRAVAFDLWETLITETPDRARAQERLRLDAMERILIDEGLGATAERIERAYRALWHRCQELYWSADRDIPCRTQIEHFLEALELDPQSFDDATLEAMEDAYANAALVEPPLLVEHAADVVRELKQRGLRVGLISNTGRTPGSTLRRVLTHLGVGEFLDTMVFSNEHGRCKPETSIFEELRDGLGVAAAETVFVGDNIYADVHGAQRFGMRGVHFVPPVRGAAVAPHFEHGLTIVPDATITSLAELPAVIESFTPVGAR